MRRRHLLLVFAALLWGAGPSPGQPATFLHRRMSDWRNDLGKAKQPAARRSAAFALARMGPLAISCVGELGKAVRGDPDAGVRDMAACAIGDIVVGFQDSSLDREWDLVGRTLREKLLSNDEPRVRRSAAYAIGAFGKLAEAAVPELRKALEDGAPKAASVRQNAAWALGRVAPDEAVVPDLCAALGDAGPLVRRDAAAALRELNNRLGREKLTGAARPLIELVKKEKDEVVTKTALGALASLVDQKHQGEARDLYPLLESKDQDLARAAAFVLGNMGGEPARRALVQLREALAEPDPGIQAMAAAVLANAGADAAPATQDLARALNASTDPVVRRNCAVAIAGIADGVRDPRLPGGGPEGREKVARQAMPALVKAFAARPDPGAGGPVLARAHEEARSYVAQAIALIGYPYNKDAIGLIREGLQKERNPDIRHKCVWALFNAPGADLERLKLKPVLVALLEEKGEDSRIIRYDTARMLADAFKEDAPDRTKDVLLEMLDARTLTVFRGTGATISGGPGEDRRGSSTGTRELKGGDARYMAAEAMGWLGGKARKDKRIMDALQKASRDDNPRLREAAKVALDNLNRGS